MAIDYRSDEPLVSVVTPVYNGEKYIAECVESVLGQGYRNWEYIILNNRSMDRTLEVIRKYAKKEPRIKVYTNDEFLEQIVNFNAALRKISPESKYCVLLMADDWLFPDCVERKVALAEKYPSVGLVGSYRLMGRRVSADGIPYPSHFTEGREIGRGYLAEEFYLGTPTNVLMRSDLVRSRPSLFDETVIHADRMLFLDLLLESDFGFVHEVLTFYRRHEETTTSVVADRYETQWSDKLLAWIRYGRRYFEEDELPERMASFLWRYYRMLARIHLTIGAGDARRHQRKRLREMGHRIDIPLFLQAFLFEFLDLRGILMRIIKRRARARLISSEEESADRSLSTIFRQKTDPVKKSGSR